MMLRYPYFPNFSQNIRGGRRFSGLRGPVNGLRLCLTACLLAACTNSATTRPTLPLSADKPIEEENYLAARRTFMKLARNHTLRASLRPRLLQYLALQAEESLAENAFSEVLETFGEMTSLYTHEELEKATLSSELAPLARYLVKRGSRMGNEAAVLSAYWVLHRLSNQDKDAYALQYRRVANWGRQARKLLPSLEYFQSLIEVWEIHAAITPAPRILDRLAGLYLARRRILSRELESPKKEEKNRVQLSFQDLNYARFVIRRTPVDIAALYLKHGDLLHAYEKVKASSQKTEAEQQLLFLLREALEDSHGNTHEATLTLARLYLSEMGQPDVSEGLCRLGQHRYPKDARFALCLARIAAVQDEYADATAAYAEAIRLNTQKRAVYDEALQVLQQLIQARLYETDPSHTRALTREAEHILKERMRRFPNSPTPVAPQQFHFIVGMAEMNAGNTREAEERFLKSVRARENAPALMRLGLLNYNEIQYEQAIKYYERALTLAKQQAGENIQGEAESLEHLADALRALGKNKQAEQRYRQAIELWKPLVQKLEDDPLAMLHVRMGILYDRIGQQQQSMKEFEAALEYAVKDRAAYEQILAHLVTSSADLELATEVYRRALRNVSLDPEWKVYFALWVQAIAARTGKPVDPEIQSELSKLVGRDAWWSRLATFAVGKLKYAELLQLASGRGEQTEAHFYEGARLLGLGNHQAASALFRRVLATDMVSFYEFAMARELLSQPPSSSKLSPPSPSNGKR